METPPNCQSAGQGGKGAWAAVGSGGALTQLASRCMCSAFQRSGQPAYPRETAPGLQNQL